VELYPAIDLRDGKVVRLLRGDFDAQTTYGDDPVAVARRFEQAGARWIHVVDLDAARAGGSANLATIEAIASSVGARVQAGGGIRSVADARRRFDAGAARVVVGSAAVEHPEVVAELAAAQPGRVAVGLDARGRDVAIHGWADTTGHDLVTLARRFDVPGVGALVVTEIGRDGTLAGPDLRQLAGVLDAVAVPVVASGGIGTLEHLRALDRRLAGVVVGRALYEGCFTVEEAIAACSASV
jgi:phosphoribosylformimino-5-aminoimidazole carboxamide ribotide isomerase